MYNRAQVSHMLSRNAKDLRQMGNQISIDPNPQNHHTSNNPFSVTIFGSDNPKAKANFHVHYNHPLAVEGLSDTDMKHTGMGIYNVVITPKNIYFYNRTVYKVNEWGRGKDVPFGSNFSLPRSNFSK